MAASGDTGRGRLRRLVAYPVVCVLASALAMAVSFQGVQWLMDRGKATPDGALPSMAALREATELRGASNRLITLLNNHLQRSSGGGADDEGFRSWYERTYRPRLRALRRELTASQSNSPALLELLAAADGLAGATVSAGDEVGAGAAVKKAEARIVSLGVADHLPERPVAPRFRQH